MPEPSATPDTRTVEQIAEDAFTAAGDAARAQLPADFTGKITTWAEAHPWVKELWIEAVRAELNTPKPAPAPN